MLTSTMRGAAFLFLSLVSLPGSVSAKDVSQAGYYKCTQGDCRNGEGTVWDAFLSVSMKGRFSGGATIPGETYVITAPIAPDVEFHQVYGADGLLESGDYPRTIGLTGRKIPFFRGKYGRIMHTFTHQSVAFLQQGTYSNGIGIEFRGQFRYLPSKGGSDSGLASGYYIFYGDMVDVEENETETGLFISDENYGGTAVRFVKADPSYLAVLQEKYRTDQQIAQSDAANRQSRWKSVFSILGRVASAYAGGAASSSLGGGGLGQSLGGSALSAMTGSSQGIGGGSGLGGDFALGLVSSMFEQGDGVSVEDLARRAVGAVGGDSKNGNAIVETLLGLASGGGKAGAGAMEQLGSAVIASTGNKITSAIDQTLGGSEAGTALKTISQNAISSLQRDAVKSAMPGLKSAPAGAGEVGSFSFEYSPGRGFYDPVRNTYVSAPEQLSCDNVTTRGVRLGDLPVGQRNCDGFK